MEEAIHWKGELQSSGALRFSEIAIDDASPFCGSIITSNKYIAFTSEVHVHAKYKYTEQRVMQRIYAAMFENRLI